MLIAIILALFVQMGASLPKGGPAGLFLGFVAYGTIVLSVNQCFGMYNIPSHYFTLFDKILIMLQLKWSHIFPLLRLLFD